MHRSCFRKSERVYHPIYGAGTVTSPSTEDALVVFDQPPSHQMEAEHDGQSAVWVPVCELTVLHGPAGLKMGDIVQTLRDSTLKYVVIRPPSSAEEKEATPQAPAIVRTARLNFPDQTERVGTIALLPLFELERTTVSPDEVIDFSLNVKAALKRGPRPILTKKYGTQDRFYQFVTKAEFDLVLPHLLSDFRSEVAKC
jgi:hypothetical protein